MIANSSSANSVSTDISGSAVSGSPAKLRSHRRSLCLPLCSRSPKERVTASTPCRRPLMIQPPIFSTRSFSSARDERWSTERSSALPPRESTQRESPTLAQKSVAAAPASAEGARMSIMMAVEPLGSLMSSPPRSYSSASVSMQPLVIAALGSASSKPGACAMFRCSRSRKYSAVSEPLCPSYTANSAVGIALALSGTAASSLSSADKS
mmetsp:Transcript_16716/g.58434  ORF Transcript_16716/g.58434 Transcript_16716/m.58434 type:complete len:209 (+) Transcript_16716:993-1619(+)